MECNKVFGSPFSSFLLREMKMKTNKWIAFMLMGLLWGCGKVIASPGTYQTSEIDLSGNVFDQVLNPKTGVIV
jgi:hypothetical protein